MASVPPGSFYKKTNVLAYLAVIAGSDPISCRYAKNDLISLNSGYRVGLLLCMMIDCLSIVGIYARICTEIP